MEKLNRKQRRALEAIRRGKPALVGIKFHDYAEAHGLRVPADVTTLEDMVRTASLMAEDKLKRHGGFDPFWLADALEDGLLVIEPMNMSTETGEDKDFLVAQVRRGFHLKRVHRYASAVEAWASSSEGVRPSEAPDRMEIVHIHGEDGTRVLSAMRDIVRSDDGKPHLTELEIQDAYNDGRFTDLLPPRSDRSAQLH
jgi:hypothetical protein